jgi:phosphonoacetate hydrolase
VCLHTAAHNWEDHGGECGEHGSLGIVQVRAPFVLAGAGVAPLGFVRRACRLVDVAPTILALLGAPRREGGQLLARQDGQILGDLIDHDAPPPDHVVGFLWDGCNANILYDLVARGEAPHLARLVDGGTVMGHGAMASLPSVTLANHTTILTGTHPGHHGVLHNAWYDRSTGEQIITNSPATWPWAMRSLVAGTETIHQAVHRFWPGAEIATASVRDSDARMGRVLDAVERAGAWDRTAFFLVADHGMEDSNARLVERAGCLWRALP